MPLGLSSSAYQAHRYRCSSLAYASRGFVIVCLRGSSLSFVFIAITGALHIYCCFCDYRLVAITGALRIHCCYFDYRLVAITGALRIHNWLLSLGDKPRNLIVQRFMNSFAHRSSIRGSPVGIGILRVRLQGRRVLCLGEFSITNTFVHGASRNQAS